MEVTGLLNQFYTELRTVEGLSENGAETYIRSAGLFLKWLNEEKISLAKVSVKELVFFFARRRTGGAEEEKVVGRTVAKDISALRAFGNFLVGQNIWQENPALLLERPHENCDLPKVLSLDEVDRFLDSINLSTFLGIRDRALFELIYSCGLRISEACSLKISNLHINERIIIVQGKGSKERMIPFGLKAKESLELYLEKARPELTAYRNPEEVFVNYKGEAISRKGVWKNFQKYAKLAGIDAKVHTLRHSFATHLLAGGMDLVSVQELLGHSGLATTTIYTHIEEKQLQAEHEKFFPGHKK